MEAVNLITKKNRQKVKLYSGDIFLGNDTGQNGRPVKLKLKDRFMHMQIFGPTGCGKTSMILLPMIYKDFTSAPFKFDDIYVHHIGQLFIDPKGDAALQFWAMGQLNQEKAYQNDKKYVIEMMKRLTHRTHHLQKVLQEFHKYSQYNQITQEDKDNYRVKCANLETYEKAFNFLKDKVQPFYLNTLTPFALHLMGTDIANLLSFPNDDEITLREYQNIPNRDRVVLFNPIADDCPYFNPLDGNESDVVNTVSNTILSFNSDSKSYFQTEGERLLTNAIKVIKRLNNENSGTNPTLKKLETLIYNYNDRGIGMINQLRGLNYPGMSKAEKSENEDIASWFINQYFVKSARGDNSKNFDATGTIRSNIAKLNQDPRLGRVLNPPDGIKSQIDFREILKTGDTIAISTSQGSLGELAQYLGKFLILQFQAAAFARNGSDGHRLPFMLYIDEFQEFAVKGFDQILTMGRSYCVGATLATQTRGLIEDKAEKGLLNTIDANCRNVITFPGINADDAKHFSDHFGDVKIQTKNVSTSSATDNNGLLSGIKKFIGADNVSGKSFNNSGDRQTMTEREEVKPYFSVTDLIYGAQVYPERAKLQSVQRSGKLDSHLTKEITKSTLGHLFYQIMQDSSIAQPGYAKVNWLPTELTKKIKMQINKYEILVKHARRIENHESNVIIHNDAPQVVKPVTPPKTTVIKMEDNINTINQKSGGINPEDNDNPNHIDNSLMEENLVNKNKTNDKKDDISENDLPDLYPDLSTEDTNNVSESNDESDDDVSSNTSFINLS